MHNKFTIIHNILSQQNTKMNLIALELNKTKKANKIAANKKSSYKQVNLQQLISQKVKISSINNKEIQDTMNQSLTVNNNTQTVSRMNPIIPIDQTSSLSKRLVQRSDRSCKLEERIFTQCQSTDQQYSNQQAQTAQLSIVCYGKQYQIDFNDCLSLKNFFDQLDELHKVQRLTKASIKLVTIAKGMKINKGLTELWERVKQQFQNAKMQSIFN